VDKVDLVGLGA